MSRDNSRDVSSLEVTLRGSQVDIDPIGNGTKPFDDVKVMLVKGIDGTGAESLAPAFSPSTYYAYGDLCTKDALLYQCNTRQGHEGAWDASDFDVVDIEDIMVRKTGDIMTGELLYASAYIGTASSKSTNKIVASLDGSEITCTLYRSPLPSTQESTDMPSGYTACRINLFESDGTTLIADKVLFDGDEWTYDLGRVTSIKLRRDFLAISTFGEEIIDGNGNQLSLKADTATVESELAEKADISMVGGLPNALSIDVDGNPIEGNFAAGAADKLIVDIKPIQDLHGYDKPWIGGAGLNECSVDTSSFSGSGSSWYSLSGASASTVTNGTKVSLKAGKHTIKLYDIINISNLQVLDSASNDYINSLSGGTFTLSSDTDVYIRIKCSSTGSMSCKTMLESGETAHDWEPYSNICPISGLTETVVKTEGKNICPTGDISSLTNIVGNLKAGTYTWSFKVVSSPKYSTSMFGLYDGNGQIITSIRGTNTQNVRLPFTLAEDTDNISLRVINYTAGPDGKYIINVQIEHGNIATDYEPYVTPNTYTIDLNGTRYGATLDVKSGVLTVEKAIVVYDGSNDESWSEYHESTYDQYFITISDANNLVSYITNLLPVKDMSYRGTESIAISRNDKILRIALLPDLGISTVAQWLAYLASNNLQVCYELATPITVQLDPETVNLLKGYNRITSNGNTVMHLSAVPEKLINYIVNAFGTDESGRTTASRAYAAKEYFYKDGFMYKVIAPIAQNAAFTEGTNCSKTTIFAELTALNA